MIAFETPDLTQNGFVSTTIDINDKSYEFIYRWNIYCNCCFLTIKDGDATIIEEFALVNNTRVETEELPVLNFIHKDGLSFEPIKETFNEYVIAYA